MSKTWPTARELHVVPPSSRTVEEQESYEENFFRLVRQKNGVFKTTWAHRFDGMNAVVNRLLPSDRPLELMDIAISSGVSTLEWVESLRAVGIHHHMVAGDSSVQAFLVSIAAGLEVLVDPDGYPLHFDVLGWGFPNTADRTWLVPAVKVLNLASAAFLRTQPGLRRYLRGDTAQVKSRVGLTCRPITLVSPRLQHSQSIEIVQDDILVSNGSRFRCRFHALRAANILSFKYFDEETLSRILVNLRMRLRPGGLLVVCRTHKDRVNHGQIFRLEAERFISIERLAQGAEIAPLVVNLHQRTSGAHDAIARS